MGLIKSILGTITGTITDTWKDYFVCDSMSDNVLLVKGTKRGGLGSSDVITNGSGIVVADGQCALIVDEGKIIEVANEPGNYTFDSTTSPSVFDGGFAGLTATFQEMLGRFTYDGVAAHNQRVYYINTKEIFGNLFGTPTPVPFRVIDKNINLDVDISVRCNGEYSIRIINPLLFYQNVSGNQKTAYYKEDISSQLRSELLSALQPALAKISAAGVRYSEVPAYTDQLRDALNEALDEKWAKGRGIVLENVAINTISASKEDEDRIKQLQLAAVNKDQTMAAATLVAAQADAMRDAAKNENGAANGFINVNYAQNTGVNVADLYNNQKQTAPAADTWTCPKCGLQATGNFCSSCGTQKPQQAYCPQCGKPVTPGANFCSSCGAKLN